MKLMPTRRRWRQLYRRSRVYLPALLLILAAMAVLLPLAPDWLRRRAEAELLKATGLPVTLEKVRAWIAYGRLDATGIEVPARSLSEPAFRIGEISLEGSLAELIAGDGNYPSSVSITRVSPIVLRRTDAGITVEGALATLLGRLDNLPRRRSTTRPDSSGTTATLTRLRSLPIPNLALRDLRVDLFTGLAGIPPLTLALEEVRMPARRGPDAPMLLQWTGAAIADSAELTRGGIAYYPVSDRARCQVDLEGLATSFTWPGVGDFVFRGRGIRANVGAIGVTGDPIQFDAEIRVADFELREKRLGGEFWKDRDVTLRARGRFSRQGSVLQLDELRIMGGEITVDASGRVALSGNLPGRADLRISRLPEAALQIGQRLAARAQVAIDRTTSSTLYIEAAAAGEFLRPANLDVEGAVRLNNWAVTGPNWPATLNLKEVSLVLSAEAASIEKLRLDFAGIECSVHGRVPRPRTEGQIQQADLHVHVAASADQLLAAAGMFGAATDEVQSAMLPVTIETEIWPSLLNQQGRLTLASDLLDIPARTRLSWGTGNILLRRLRDPVRIGAGQIDATPEALHLSRVRATTPGVALVLGGSLEGRPRFWEGKPRFAADVSFDGNLSETLRLASSEIRLPDSIPPIVGDVHLDAETSGTWGDWDNLGYAVHGRVDRLTTELQIPDSLLHVDGLSARFDLDPTGLRVPLLDLGLEAGDATARGSLVIDEKSARVSLTGRSELSVAPVVSPRDLQDLVGEGTVPFEASASLTPLNLPPGHDVLRRWVSLLKSPGVRIGISDAAPLRLRLNGRLYQEGDVRFYPRDFPHPISNIHGDIRVDETGFDIRDATADFGNWRNIAIRGLIKLQFPVTITFDLHAPEIDINDWMDGWSEQPWNVRPYIAALADRPLPTTPRLMTIVEGHLLIDKSKFLTVPGRDFEGTLRYEYWRGGNKNRMFLENLKAKTYGGTVEGNASFHFPGGGKHVVWYANGKYANIDVQKFLTDLRERPDPMVGLLTGDATLRGAVGEHATWIGEGEFELRESNMIGGSVLKSLKAALKVGSEGQLRSTSIKGRAMVKDERVYFPAMKISSPAVDINATGNIDFHANMDFDITARVLTKQISRIPVVGLVTPLVSPLVDTMADALVSLRMGGTVDEPSVRAVPLLLDKFGMMQKAGKSEPDDYKKPQPLFTREQAGR